MREWRPTSTRSSPQAEAAPCSQAACQRPDSARRPLYSCTGTAVDRRKGARKKKDILISFGNSLMSQCSKQGWMMSPIKSLA